MNRCWDQRLWRTLGTRYRLLRRTSGTRNAWFWGRFGRLNGLVSSISRRALERARRTYGTWHPYRRNRLRLRGYRCFRAFQLRGLSFRYQSRSSYRYRFRSLRMQKILGSFPICRTLYIICIPFNQRSPRFRFRSRCRSPGCLRLCNFRGHYGLGLGLRNGLLDWLIPRNCSPTSRFLFCRCICSSPSVCWFCGCPPAAVVWRAFFGRSLAPVTTFCGIIVRWSSPPFSWIGWVSPITSSTYFGVGLRFG